MEELKQITERQEQLESIISKLDDDRKAVLMPLIIEIVFMEGRLRNLRDLPHIRTHPKNKARQEITPAGKQYKETMQAYLNAIKVVMTAIYKADNSAADELVEKLKEFEL